MYQLLLIDLHEVNNLKVISTVKFKKELVAVPAAIAGYFLISLIIQSLVTHLSCAHSFSSTIISAVFLSE